MRGDFLHNRVLVEQVAARFEALGANVRREYRSAAGYTDVFVEFRGWRIACEAELCTARIGRDIAKAMFVKADLLVIVVPTRTVARSVGRRVRRICRSLRSNPPPIIVAPIGALLQGLAHLSRIEDTLNVLATFSPKWRKAGTDNRPLRSNTRTRSLT